MYKALLFFITALLASTPRSTSAQGIITTIAGNGVTQYIGDGYPATVFSLADPSGICMDKNKNILVADYTNQRIRKIDMAGNLSTISGDGTIGYTGDGGPFAAATYRYPNGICMDTGGNLYITEIFNSVVRKVNAVTGMISTVCGTGTSGFSGDGGFATTAKLETPSGACVDLAGNIYIPDFGNQRIRKVSAATGIISTYAGNGMIGYGGDGGPATTAMLAYPDGVCTDRYGNVYISDGGNNVIRKVDAATGVITTVAGKTTSGFSGDGGLAINAELRQPNAVFVDKHGNLFISDNGNNVIREVNTSGIIYTVAGNTMYGFTGDGGYATFATFNGTSAVYVDDSDFLYIADIGNSAIRKVTPRTSGINDMNAALVMQVYPNPSLGKFIVNINGNASDITAAIYDVTGRVVYEKNISEHITSVDLSDKSPGIYYLKISSPYGMQSQKIVLQN